MGVAITVSNDVSCPYKWPMVVQLYKTMSLLEIKDSSSCLVFLFAVCSVLLLYNADCVLQVHDPVKPNEFQLTVDGSSTIQFITHFWESTGFW